MLCRINGETRRASDSTIRERRPAGVIAYSAHGSNISSVRFTVDGRARAVNTKSIGKLIVFSKIGSDAMALRITG